MNADARDGSLRAKRCLPAKFHAKTAHYDLPKDQIGPPAHELLRRFSSLGIPKSRQP